MAVVLTYKLLIACKNRNKPKDGPGEVDKSDLARILGWCIEILQGFFLVHDDIMDQSLTRRNQICWYKNVSGLPYYLILKVTMSRATMKQPEISCQTSRICKMFFLVVYAKMQ